MRTLIVRLLEKAGYDVLELSAVVFIEKPFAPAVFLDRVRELAAQPD